MARLALLTLACLVGAFALPHSPISPSLLLKFETQNKVNIVIEFAEGVGKAYKEIEGRHFSVRGAKMTALRDALIKHTETSQQSVRQFLTARNVHYKTHWITNRIIIEDAEIKLVRELAENPSIAVIREEVVVQIEEPVVSTKSGKQPGPQWGVDRVRAPEMWDIGHTGEGIIVSSIDTGVMYTHEILNGNWRQEKGWYSPSSMADLPHDDNGHGTHTMGTIAGQDGYGVAPGAQWISCMGCAGSSCSENDLIACGEFIACPHDPDGSNPDCSMAPHLVSNSWGSTLGGQTWYDDVIDGWHAASIIPVFSAGNAGPFCESVGSPGDRNVIGVGATDRSNVLADFSSIGPTVTGEMKPDISAPGVAVESSYIGGDSSYASLSGTSMACPHVAGSLALLFNADPSLVGDYEGVRSALFMGAETEGLEGWGQNCDGVDEGTFPNHAFGHGLLDIYTSSGNMKKIYF